MEQNNNPMRNLRVEFHILQSFPVTCLNRDDVGAPKTAVVGGVNRARVSSQCWKRQVRLALQEQGISLGTRTKLIKSLIENECKKQGARQELAEKCGLKVEQIFIKGAGDERKGKKSEDTEETTENSGEKTDTLIFLSPSEVKKIAAAFAEKGFDANNVITQKDVKKQAKEIADILGSKPNYALDGLDIALFGRMVAQAATLNVEAAASFAHAISTHRVTNEVEFFTAIDDRQEEPGSAHMGSLEFNSATYYRYVCLDLGQLYTNLGGQIIPQAVEAFIKALYVAVPGARQATQSGASPWEFAKILVRKGQRLQMPFETAVKEKDGGFLEPSKQALVGYLEKHEKLSGSMFGKIAEFTFGENTEFNIDMLIDGVTGAIAKAV